MYFLGCTNLFEQLNKMKVLGCIPFWVCLGREFFVCLFVFGFVLGAFSLLLFSGLKTSPKFFLLRNPDDYFSHWMTDDHEMSHFITDKN